jgi:hypothetical protein
VIAVGIISWIAGVNAGTMIASSGPSSAETPAAVVDLTGEESADLTAFRNSLDVLVDQGGSGDDVLAYLDELELSAERAERQGQLTTAELQQFRDELESARASVAR